MKNPPRISDAEWQVMEAVWARNPISAAEVIEALAGETSWKGNTVRTLLARLVKKGALVAEPDGNRYLYTPVFPRAEYVTNESWSFLERVFQGSAKPLLIHFVNEADLSREDIAEFKRILKDKKSK